MKSSEFKELLLPYSSRLYSIAFRLLNSREEAEDMVQEVYLKLWKMRTDLGKYESVEALSVRITRNQCLDLLRRRKVKLEVHENEKRELLNRSERNPEQVLEQKERSAVILKLINQLPEPQRSLVHFRHIEGKEYEEIEKLMDMNVNAIRVSISRARKQMKDMLLKQYASWTN